MLAPGVKAARAAPRTQHARPRPRRRAATSCGGWWTRRAGPPASSACGALLPPPAASGTGNIRGTRADRRPHVLRPAPAAAPARGRLMPAAARRGRAGCPAPSGTVSVLWDPTTRYMRSPLERLTRPAPSSPPPVVFPPAFRSSRAITFVDNHDTGSTLNHWPFPSHHLQASGQGRRRPRRARPLCGRRSLAAGQPATRPASPTLEGARAHDLRAHTPLPTPPRSPRLPTRSHHPARLPPPPPRRATRTS